MKRRGSDGVCVEVRVYDRVQACVGDLVRARIRDYAWNLVRARVRDRIYDRVWGRVRILCPGPRRGHVEGGPR